MSCLFMSLFWLMVLDLFWLGVVGCRMIGAGLVLLVLAGGVGLVWLCGVFVWPGLLLVWWWFGLGLVFLFSGLYGLECRAGLVWCLVCFCLESLILAQDERWRRA